jgi:hypothetical protein
LPFVAHEAPMYKKGKARRGPSYREALLDARSAALSL